MGWLGRLGQVAEVGAELQQTIGTQKAVLLGRLDDERAKIREQMDDVWLQKKDKLVTGRLAVSSRILHASRAAAAVQ